jgi:DNA-binding protein HU-beta
MTKSEVAAHLAEQTGLTRKEVTALLAAQAELAYRQAKNIFTLPGIGKLKLVDSPARKMIQRFGANAGKEMVIPRRKKVKFSIARAAKMAILGSKK